MPAQRHQKHTIDFLFPAALFLVFAVSALCVMLLAAGIYRQSAVETAKNDVSRTALSYISEKIHQGDSGDAVHLDTFDGLDALAIREQGSAAQRLMQAADSCGTALPTAAQLAESSGLDTDTLARTLAELLSSGQLAEPLPGRYVSASALDALWPRCRDALANYHGKRPLHAGMPAAELRQKLFRGTEPAEGDALLFLEACDRRRITVREGDLRRLDPEFLIK